METIDGIALILMLVVFIINIICDLCSEKDSEV
jgi:hypothetical protein